MVLCGHTMLSALAIIVIYRQCLVRLVNLVSLSSIIDIRLLGWVVWIMFCKVDILKLLVGIELILLTALIVHRLLVLVLLIHVAQWVVHSLQVVVVLLGIEHIILREWLRLNWFSDSFIKCCSKLLTPLFISFWLSGATTRLLPDGNLCGALLFNILVWFILGGDGAIGDLFSSWISNLFWGSDTSLLSFISGN